MILETQEAIEKRASEGTNSRLLVETHKRHSYRSQVNMGATISASSQLSSQTHRATPLCACQTSINTLPNHAPEGRAAAGDEIIKS